ncbi:MAG TPA: Stk1 family PASTA domain-containing Ser/Thr kinase [Propionibacteriaceae bacterium]|nr:Stk1 family PASTA domain-containing Ser/Thr kinase [Propionibacteriaceae bacterium]
MPDESTGRGAPRPWQHEVTSRLAPEANTASFPTVLGANVTMTTVSDPLVGRLLDGRYQITQRLARGGMATVYRAVDMRLTRTVAVKVMHVGLGDEAEFARKFDREARAAAKLSHPNVVSVFDQGQDVEGSNSRPYIVMEYVEGQTLRDVLNREAPLPPARALEVMEPVLAALAAAHDAGLVHRDVKPENVLISDRGRIKVADFGLAKAVSSQSSTATQGLLIGTVSYLPPELVVAGRADARSDVYSAGVVLFELLTGRKPHTGDTPIQIAYAHVHRDVPPPSVGPTGGPIPPYVDALVTRATARDGNLRQPDAKVLLAQVRRARIALQQGLADDPELTRELRSAPRQAACEAKRDRADYEVTQMVPTPVPVAQAQPRSSVRPRTVIDAPPPAIARPLHAQTAERLAATERERRARKRRRGWLAFLLVVLISASAALAGWYLTEGRFTTAPALDSLSKAEAEQVVAKVGLSIDFSEAYSETVARGMVISTKPGPGTKILKGAKIEAALSKGPERYQMPAVVGLSESAAEAAIEKAKLTVGKVADGYSDQVAVGTVISASQQPGVRLKKRTAINIVVCAGPKPIPITDYRGTPYDAAAAALTSAGFRVVEKSSYSHKVAKDLVLRQDPRSGGAAPGTTITLTRSLGPQLVQVPNVQRMAVPAARKVMREAGFKTQLQPIGINRDGLGHVVYTNPGTGAELAKGSTIILYVV